MITYCHPYSTSSDPLGDYCEYTHKRISDHNLFLYDTGARCPKCGHLIERLPY